jgi:UDP-N-acetylmuramate dehydrogenase
MALPCLIQENASLKPHNTFGIEAKARWRVRLRVPESLPEILKRAEWAGLPLLAMGGGSNILFRRDYDGLVLVQDSQRIERLGENERGVLVRAEAGRRWHGFVEWCIEQGLGGVENLALIPGSVGAAPIQNIGAYGVELDSVVESVEVFDLETGEFRLIGRHACQFGYRTSVFKDPLMLKRYVITAVRFRLAHAPMPQLEYPGVQDELIAMGVQHVGIREVAEAICRIRRRKIPDPAIQGNAGSFFKNPVITLKHAQDLAARFPGMPMYTARDATDKCKLAAGWLIDTLGLRGLREGDAAVSDTHALVLVNLGNATGVQIASLAERVAERVFEHYGVRLEPEPTII